MLKIVILDGATLGDDVDLSPLYDLGEVTLYPHTAPEEIASRLTGADVCVVNKLKMHRANLQGTGLKVICEAATGFDNINLDDCRALGIAVCNVPGYSTHSVAQLSVAMALSLIGHLPEYRRFVHSGQYSAGTTANALTPVWHELCGQTWGIVGGGNIGRQVARIAESFGCKVLICRRKPDPDFETVDIDTLCKRADILSLHVPLNEQTRGMLSDERIRMMKRSAIVINVARGAVADETALANAIKEQRLGGLGVDVFSTEPLPMDHPYQEILGFDNVLLTPHTAWGSYEARCRCVREMAENARAFFDGELRNRVDAAGRR